MTSNEDLFSRAQAAIPGGVNSPVRAYGSVGGTPRFIASAEGAYLTDADGRRYVDLVCSWGPAILGHAHPEVVDAVQQAASRGLSFGAPTLAEIELAETIDQRVGACDLVRLVSTGTEATMTAIRLARGFTGRDTIIKFAGCYHGHSDALLAAAGSGLATQGLPGSAGVTAAAASDTIVVAYNDLDAIEAVFAEVGDQVAAIITEAAPANMGVVLPHDHFNAALAELAHEHGALLISDEVLTGFRTGYAGWWGLEAENGSGYAPDLITFGKVVGGGMPLAALGGRRDIMTQLAPLGPVYQAGTLSGNPLATAAGLATLRLAEPVLYDFLNLRADQLTSAIGDALVQAGVPYCINRAGTLFSVFLGDGPASTGVSNYDEAQTQDTAAFGRFFHAMLDAGVNLPPSGYEAWFLSAAHDDEAMERIIDALPAAARAAASR